MLNSTHLLTLKDICMAYDGDLILDHISLHIEEGEFVTLLGPSGCGKTTTLRIIGGFTDPDEGEVTFDGQTITDLPAYKRPINTVFQRYALFGHLNVYDNVAFGLKVKKLDKKEIQKRVSEMLALVNLKGFERRRINKLSGGQQQRVAIARALVNYPKMLLLDEPLGALDLKLRKEMQAELKAIQQKLGLAFVYVTHDQEEALTMSDRIIVMKEGEIQQIGTPEDIYNEPTNAFVADFIGESNIFDGTMLCDRLVNFGGANMVCVDIGFGEQQPVDVVVRPEDIKLVEAADQPLVGVVESVIFKGVHYEIFIRCNDLLWVVHATKHPAVGQKVGLNIQPDDIHIMNRLFPTFDNRLPAKVDGEKVEVLGVAFTPNTPVKGDTVTVVMQPKDIEIVSEDQADLVVYLESMVYKGAYNEMIVWAKNEAGEYQSLLLHSQNDEQIATNIGIKFHFDAVEILPSKAE